MTTVAVLTNRRDLYIHGALRSLREHVTGWDRVVVFDDSGDDAWRNRLCDSEDVTVVPVAPRPAGYTAAMRRIWSATTGSLFLLEEDFRFTRPVNLTDLHTVLDGNPRLAQVALQRPPWYRNERRAGVIPAQRARIDAERAAAGRPPTQWTRHATHLEHTAGVTCNPALWSAAAFTADWPNTAWSETAMGDQLLAAGFTAAYYGHEGDAPHVEHVGATRAETSGGY